MFNRSMARQISLFGAILVLVGLLAACGGNGAQSPYQKVAPPEISPGSDIRPPAGEVVLTLSGDIKVRNVGDTLKFDMPTLESLGLVKYTINDPWLRRDVTYTGVLVSDLYKFAGVSPSATNVHVIALDDYEVDFATEDLHKWPILLATRSNGEHMTIENSGPTRFIPPIHRYPGILNVYQRSHWIWNLATMEFNSTRR